MEIPQELRMRDQKQCEDAIKVFITVQPTSFTSLELPKLSKQLKLSYPTRIGGAWNGWFYDEWAALNFRVRTSLKTWASSMPRVRSHLIFLMSYRLLTACPRLISQLVRNEWPGTARSSFSMISMELSGSFSDLVRS